MYPLASGKGEEKFHPETYLNIIPVDQTKNEECETKNCFLATQKEVNSIYLAILCDLFGMVK